MTRLTRKLMISILTVVLSISALGTTTFAWFTVTNVATVESFSAQIVSDTGIEVSLDGETWVNSLTEAMIQAYITENYGTFRFNHVTSTNGRTFQTLAADSLPTAPVSTYLSIVIFFRTTAVEAVKWSNATISGENPSWNADVAFTPSNGTPVLAGAPVLVNASNAMRVSVVSPKDSDKTIVYEKAAVTEGVVAENTFLGAGGDLSNGGVGDDGAMNYYYAKNNALPFGTATAVTASSVSALPDDFIMMFQSTTSGAIEYLTEFAEPTTIQYNTPLGGYVVVNVWFEGYDAEAYNSLLNRLVTLGLTFEGYTIPTP